MTGYIDIRVTAVMCLLIALVMPQIEFIPFSANGAGLALTLFGLGLVARDGIMLSLDMLTVEGGVLRYYLVDSSIDIHDTLVPDIIIAVDVYLIAIVLLIFGLCIYQLFVSRIDQAEVRYPTHPCIARVTDRQSNRDRVTETE